MTVRLRDRLQPVIASVLDRNAATDTELEGGAFCATLERAPDGEPWVQVLTGVLNIFYPSDEPPLERLRRIAALPEGTSCPSWEAWKFATLKLPSRDAFAMASLVEELFVSLYGFPDDTEVTARIDDLR